MAKTVVTEPERRRRRPTKQGVVLTEALIVETALRMVREHGAAGLSARRLGLALGADASTVYRYFRNMDELTLALADELMRRALAQWQATGASWREDLYRLGLRIHQVYLAHPQAAVLTASRVSGRANELAADEALRMREHMATCRACRHLLDALRAENRVLSESLSELSEGKYILDTRE